MRRTIFLVSVLPFASAFLGGMLAFSIMAPPWATAQSSDLQEVRASAFVVVGPDGAVVARLAPGTEGAGNLRLNSVEGTGRVALTGSGALNVFAEDGTTLAFRAGYGTTAVMGNPSVNGVQLGPDGSVSTLP